MLYPYTIDLNMRQAKSCGSRCFMASKTGIGRAGFAIEGASAQGYSTIGKEEKK